VQPTVVPRTKTILIIEDDPASRELVRLAVQSQSYNLVEATTGDDGLEKARSESPDLILLDINLPGMSGLDVCRKLRAEGSLVPIIMLTGKTDTIDKVVGLEVGADDYVTKPFEVRELLARVGAHLRRSESVADVVPNKTRREFPGLVIDIGRRQVWRDGTEIRLTVTEFNVLGLLTSRPGQVFSRNDLLKEVWGYEMDIETRTVDAHVYRLRKKIEVDSERPRYIHSVPGIGYRFAVD
jgi:DNA-binding response OmpR family regulator